MVCHQQVASWLLGRAKISSEFTSKTFLQPALDTETCPWSVSHVHPPSSGHVSGRMVLLIPGLVLPPPGQDQFSPPFFV